MRKRDCLYLHALCALLRLELEGRREFADDAFESYERLDISPTEIHRSKSDHREATRALLAVLDSALDGRGGQTRIEANDGSDGERP